MIPIIPLLVGGAVGYTIKKLLDDNEDCVTTNTTYNTLSDNYQIEQWLDDKLVALDCAKDEINSIKNISEEESIAIEYNDKLSEIYNGTYKRFVEFYNSKNISDGMQLPFNQPITKLSSDDLSTDTMIATVSVLHRVNIILIEITKILKAHSDISSCDELLSHGYDMALFIDTISKSNITDEPDKNTEDTNEDLSRKLAEINAVINSIKKYQE